MFIVVIYTLYNQKVQLEIQNNPFKNFCKKLISKHFADFMMAQWKFYENIMDT